MKLLRAFYLSVLPRLYLVCMFSIGLITQVEAQTTTGLGRAWPIPEVEEKPVEQPANKETTQPEAAPADVPAQSSSPASQEDVSFNIFEIVVDGNTVLTADTIEKAIYPYLGEHKTVADVEGARIALEKAFNSAGYPTVFVNVPEQEVNEGIVKLEVMEGKVEKLRVVGAQYNSLTRLKSTVSELNEGKVPHFPTVQKQMAAVNVNQDRVVAPVLRPGKTPGMVEVDLKVDDKLPVHASLEVNNRYNPNTTPTRLTGNLRYDNLWQRDHSLSIGFQVTPEDTNQTKVLTGTYVIPYKGDYFASYAVISDSNVSVIGDVNVIGNGNIVGFRYIHPLLAVESLNHNLMLGMDYKNFKQSTFLNTSLPDGATRDSINAPIHYLPLTAGYTGNFSSASSVTKLDMNINFSIRGFGNHTTDFANKRYRGNANYFYLRGQLEHTERIKQWQLYGALGGQWTKDHLVPNEEYFLGGLNTVRGYLEANALGDTGVNAKLELRTPEVHPSLFSVVTSVQGLAFYDYGFAKTYDQLPDQTAAYYLASTGLGVHLKAPHGVFAQFDFAHVLRTVQYMDSGHERVLFRLGFDW